VRVWLRYSGELLLASVQLLFYTLLLARGHVLGLFQKRV